MTRMVQCDVCGRFRCSDGSYARLTAFETSMVILAGSDVIIEKKICPDCRRRGGVDEKTA